MTQKKEDKPIREYEVKCWGCGHLNKINSKEHPLQTATYEKKKQMVCLQCGLHFSESLVKG